MNNPYWVQFINQETYELDEITAKLSETEFGRWCKELKDKKVLLKPNLLSAQTPDRAVTTHPVIIEAILNLISLDKNRVILADSPGSIEKGIERVWMKTGMTSLKEKYNIDLVCLEKYDKIEMEGRIGKYPLTKLIKDVDYIVNLPKLKTHSLTTMTGAIKNLYGLIPGLAKGNLHFKAPGPKDFSKIPADIYDKVKPAWTVMDGILGMDGNGPGSGRLIWTNVIIISPDSLALDIALHDFAGVPLENSPIMLECFNLKIKPDSIDEISIINKQERLKDFNAPATTIINKLEPIIKRFGRLFWIRLAINQSKCKKCMICIQKCPAKAISDSKEGFRIDTEKCISCLCCHELCPYGAIELKVSPLLKLRQKAQELRNKLR
ncbi:MAG: DUF362 domain-containing protein [Candidatus Coatesbacteria bacterium]|nr:DUF362 domain-containing protein [Candidatus Coatesbacteria bacterium]